RVRVERVDLVEPNDFRLFGKAMPIAHEFLADRAVGPGDILYRTVDEVQDYSTALDMAEKAGADARTFARSRDQPGEIGQHKLLLMPAHDAELRLQCRKRVVGDLGPGMRDRSEKGRFAGVGQPHETNVGNQFKAQPYPGLMTRPAGIGAPRRAIGRALVMGVAKAAIAAPQENAALAGPRQVGEHLAVLLVHDLGPDRDGQDEILGVGPSALAPRTRTPVGGPEM